MADEAAFLISQQAAAFGALPGYVPYRSVVVLCIGYLTTTITVAYGIIGFGMFFQDAGDGIGTG